MGLAGRTRSGRLVQLYPAQQQAGMPGTAAPLPAPALPHLTPPLPCAHPARVAVQVAARHEDQVGQQLTVRVAQRREGHQHRHGALWGEEAWGP
jgi:hypothetical protein